MDRFLQGRMGKGEYGIESDLFNTRKKVVSYKRISEDAELLPYYFLFAVPRMAGAYPRPSSRPTDGAGIQGDFEDHFRKYFAADFPKLRLAKDPLPVNKAYARQLLRRGRVTHLRLVKNDVPTDLADLVKLGLVQDQGVMEFRVRAMEGKSSQVLKTGSLDDLLSSSKYKNFDIKLQLEVDGKTHTLNLGSLETTRTPDEYDITKKLDVQGRSPEYARLKELGMELCLQLADDLGLSV